jgi:hypothetical protein
VYLLKGAASSQTFGAAEWRKLYDDVLPALPARVTVNEVLKFPDGRDAGLFNLQIDGVTKAFNVGNGGSTGLQVVSVGDHTVSETPGVGTNKDRYHVVIGGDCAANGIVSVALGDRQMCTITNYNNFGGCGVNRKCCEPGAGEQGCQICAAVNASCP